MEDLIILGCGGHAKSVIDVIEKEGKYRILGFVDRERDDSYEYRGYQIIGTDDELERLYAQGVHHAVICVGFVGHSDIRQRLYRQLKEIGYILPNIISSSADIAADAVLGEGIFVGKQAVINAEAVVGDVAIINTGAIVEHECRIGAFTHIAVGSVVCGNVRIGKNCMIGAGATIIQGVRIGKNAIVGAQAAVVSDIPEGVTVKGIPAR